MFKSANSGKLELIFRVFVGIVLIALPHVTQLGLWSDAFAHFGMQFVGAVLFLTALVRFCPLYRLIGTNTCQV